MEKIFTQKGFAALFITFLVLAIVFGIITSISVLVFNQNKISRNVIASSQAYYAAEAGAEDALLRLKNNLNFSSPYNFGVESALAEVEVSGIISGSRTITSKGSMTDRIRKIQVSYAVSSDQVSFYYGAQAGEGGIVMENNSKIKGNVFSNGSVLGGHGAEITDSLIVAGEKIDQINVGGDAKVYNCYSSRIQGDLFYVDGGTIQNCNVSGETWQAEEFGAEDFPISAETIEKWKNEAKEGDLVSGNRTVDGNYFLGPAHIQGNLVLENNSNLKMQGTILVSGDLTIKNNAVLDLDENYYHSLSGVLIVEGKTLIRNGGIIRGSGQPGSYLMIVSLNNSLENAVQIDNTSDGSVFFVPYGAILLKQTIKIREATAYKIVLEQTAEIEYEVGLSNIFFSSGSGGGWKILSWKEIE